jgi:diguanylate cyclase (GGDEF)-like protein
VSESIRAITSSLELPEVLRLVLERIKTLTEAEALSLLLHDPARDELVFAATETLRERTFAGLRGEAAGGVAAWVARTGRVARMNDPGEAWRYGIDAGELAHAKHNLLAVPVHRGGRVIGALELADRYDGTEFTPQDEVALIALADALGSRADPASLASDAVALRHFFSEVAAAVPSEDVMLVLLDPDGRERLLGASRRLEAGFVDGLRLRLDQGIAGWVARHREAVRLEDVRSDPRYYPEIERLTGFAPRTMLCVPLVMKGRLLGVIQCLNKLDGTAFSEEELQLVQTLADHAAIAIENASLYREARAASLTDDLTGLSNTRHFNEILPTLLSRGTPVSLIVLDLDSFKAVVDTHGHLVGSRTIGQVGRQIAALLRPGDVAARFGGDEFVVILPDTKADEALVLGERIRASIEEMKLLEGTSIDVSSVTASLGVASFPRHARTAEGLFQAADRAMYAVKASRKNAVALATATDSSASTG